MAPSAVKLACWSLGKLRECELKQLVQSNCQLQVSQLWIRSILWTRPYLEWSCITSSCASRCVVGCKLQCAHCGLILRVAFTCWFLSDEASRYRDELSWWLMLQSLSDCCCVWFAALAAAIRDSDVSTWLILPVVICLSQRLSHACLSISFYTAKLRMAH